jgi:enterochelin esterase-like enzyme
LKSAVRRRYPTLYLLHGDPSGPYEWLSYGTPALFDAGFVRGDLPETIVVMPDGNGHVTAATQWANRWDGRDRTEDALLELVAAIDREYRTMPDRQYRLIGGLSSGAFGAVNIAARHPDLFGVAMGFSGYYQARGPVFGSNAGYIAGNSPIVLIERSPAARSVHYILTVGAADHYRAYMDQFVQQLRRFGVSYDSTVVPGGHQAQVWIDGLVYSIGVIKTQLAIPANDHRSLR